DFKTEYADLVVSRMSRKGEAEDYYLKMMAAWYFATALAKNWNQVLPFIEQHKLDPWTHNKAIQKALESFRVSDEHKEYLRKLKV
ncbi:MAG: DNA alkylation repair protein, partial [Treponema sp.]|nr:DNA alkylation repair protein [Treponema sp.]